MGSTMIAGDRVAIGLERFRNGSQVVERQHDACSPAIALGTPADDGWPNVSAPEPAFTSRLSPWPW